MATKPDILAAKQRKQKIVLAVGGVLLLAVAAFQGPKLFKHGSSSSSSAPAGAPATAPAPGTAAAAPGGSVSPGKARLAGVILAPAPTPSAGQGQLFSFSRFKSKDPFVQQVQGAAAAAPAAPAAPGTAKQAAGGGAGIVATAPPVAPPTYATILVNRKPQQLVLKQLFPKGEPTFVLAKVAKKTVRVGVAGGKFTDGSTVQLELGKPVTLMNTTTGQRYVMKLVFTGAQPEQIASFKGGKATDVRLTASSKP